VKIAPPLTITEEALREGLAVLAEAVEEAIAASGAPATPKTVKGDLAEAKR
jgi:hypothetical protein